MLVAGLGCVHWGRKGFMPLDHPIAFDGAWRICSGQIPFRDFHLPAGLLPSVAHAVVMACVGPSWTAFVLHAAVANALFAAMGYALLRRQGLSRGRASAYAIAAACTLFPPIGVPYADPYAFFVATAAIALAVRARATAGIGAWALCALALAASAAAKPVPAAYLVPVVVVLATVCPVHRTRAAIGLGAGLVATVAIATVLEVACGMRWDWILEYGIALPRATGRERLGQLFGARSSELWLLVGWSRQPDSSWFAATIPAVWLALLACLAGRWRAHRSGSTAPVARDGPVWLAAALMAICIAFALLTHNQHAGSMPWLALAAGLADAGLGASTSRRLALGLVLVIRASVVADCMQYCSWINPHRAVNDLYFHAGVAPPAALAGLEWSVPSRYRYEPEELEALIAWARRYPGNLWLVGDTSLVYALAGKPSPAPALWLHPGLTQPAMDAPRWSVHEAELWSALARHDVRVIVLEGRESWNKVALDRYPRIAQRVRERGRRLPPIGPFARIELPAGVFEGGPAD